VRCGRWRRGRLLGCPAPSCASARALTLRLCTDQHSLSAHTYTHALTPTTNADHLLDLGRASANSEARRVYTGAAAIVLFHRPTGKSLEGERVRSMELLGGRAALEALAAFVFPGEGGSSSRGGAGASK
jgi:hypothetical protein